MRRARVPLLANPHPLGLAGCMHAALRRRLSPSACLRAVPVGWSPAAPARAPARLAASLDASSVMQRAWSGLRHAALLPSLRSRPLDPPFSASCRPGTSSHA